MIEPMTSARRRPQMSPSFAPSSIERGHRQRVEGDRGLHRRRRVLSRSSTTVEIDTFMTVPSSTMTNWAAPRISTTNHFFMCRPILCPGEGRGVRSFNTLGCRAASRGEGHALAPEDRLS